ncbi:unnamed protein product [Mytilus coruscus]|uniref:Uncharacterized protein n=1 Tax=Mytilus coruscus TaxID=42192 RepID=A0A6J8AHF5_MYTCO|nr:unnamed protein product [Mytilus coruscus]
MNQYRQLRQQHIVELSLKSMDRTIDVCRTLRATVISLIRLGVHPAISNPIVCSKFVKQVCYPKALYGCKLWGKLTSTEWLMLERTQHYICTNIQGLPRRTRSDMCLPMIGWFSIESYVDEKKLLFLGRICNLPYESVSFRILIRRVNDLKYNDGSHPNLGFTVDIMNILQKYDLSTYFDNFCETGRFPTPLVWKRIVKTGVAAFEIVDWTRRINFDDDFVAFKTIKKAYVPHSAWTVALKHPNQTSTLFDFCLLFKQICRKTVRMSTEKHESLKFYKYLCQKIGSEEVVRMRRLALCISDMSQYREDRIASGSKGEGLYMKGSDFDIMGNDSTIKVYE